MRHRTTDTAKGHRNYIIIACDVLLFLAMLKWLPVEPDVARGLAVLTFIGILWLTEALHVTVTALLVPVLAMFMGILPGAKALAGFADPTIFLFFGGFALAGCLYCSMQSGLSNSGAAKAEFQPIIGKTKQRNKRGSIFIKVLAIIAVSFKFNIEFFDNRICRRFINGFYMIFLISCAQQNGIFCFASLSSMSSMYI